VKLLLAVGSPADSPDDPYGITPLMEAARSGSLEAVDLLLAAGAERDRFDQSGLTALHYAAWYGRAKVAARLLEVGANPNTITDSLFETPLHYAVRFGDASLISLLLAAGTAREARDSDGRTALALAVLSRRPDNVPTLLDAGAAVDTRDANGATPLLIAARDGQVEIASVLLAHDADPGLSDYAGGGMETYLAYEPISPQPNEHSAAAVLIVDEGEVAELRAAHEAIRQLLAGR
jgi:cytohesin